MKPYIIGIAGELNSGKDTVASMINYIFKVGVTKANYAEWITHKVSNDLRFGDRVISFADPLKDCLSIMFGIKREYFDDRDKKDVEWFCLTERRFVSPSEAEHSRYIKITIEDLSIYSLSDRIDAIEMCNGVPIIKVRTLMQYFGTNIGKKQIGSDIWINSTMSKAADIARARRVCIIPDVRYIDERNAITGNLLYGGVIKINRDNSGNPNHSSEVIDFKCSHTIDNNGTKMGLFYNVIGIVQDIIE